MSDQDRTQGAAHVAGDVAIVGMACIFPAAPDLPTYWQNIVNKVDAIIDPPPDRLINEVFDPASDANDRIYCKRGGYIESLPPFRPADFGIMPVAVEGALPEHFMALKVAHDAMCDAGFPDRPFDRQRTRVIVGRGTFINRGYVTLLQHGFVLDQTIRVLGELHPEYSTRELAAIKTRLKDSLPPFRPETAPGLVDTIVAGIIANRLDLKGGNLVIDAACASGLMALEIGMRDLLTGHCDVLLTGAIQISTPHLIHLLFTQLGALTRHAQLRPFDKDADGTMLGEGVGMMVLKRLEDAVRDGHRIYAVVKGVGSSSDGKGKGLTAPQVDGEVLALQRAYAAARVEPRTVGMIEAHGTALPVGDAAEIEALGRVLGARDGAADCALGTVKSMIGHLLPAAGVAGLIKTALSLYHRALPPTLHCETPNPDLKLEQSRFYLNTETRPWIHGAPDTPRRAGVNAFGFGGINAHAVLEEWADEGAAPRTCWRGRDSELCVLSAASREDLAGRADRVLSFIANSPGAPLHDLAHTLAAEPDRGAHRLAVVAASLDDLAQKLRPAVQRLREPGCEKIKRKSGVFYFAAPLAAQGRLAFLFPGEGSQYPNMLADLCLHFPEARSCFDTLDGAFADRGGAHRPSDFIFPAASAQAPGQAAADRLWQMDYAVDAVLTADWALHRIFDSLGIRPGTIVGHSSGEIMALEACGAIQVADHRERMGYIAAGNRMIQRFAEVEAIPDAPLMAVALPDRKLVDDAVRTRSGRVRIAMDNCPYQVVLCCDREVVEEVAQELQDKGAICQVLPFARPYHTPLFEPAGKSLETFFDSLRMTSPRIEIYSCLTAEPMPADAAEIRRLAVAQWTRPVRFRETIAAMHAGGVRLFVEVGPKANLTSFVDDVLRGRPHAAVAANVHYRSGITQLHHALALLFAHGVPMRLEPLFERRGCAAVDLDTREAPRPGDAGKGAMQLSLALPRLTLGEDAQSLRARAAPPAPAAGETPAEEKGELPPAMRDYMDTMEQFLDTQDTVMQAYFADTPAPAAQDPAGPPRADYAMVSMPLVDEVLSRTEDTLVAQRTFTLAEDLFLLDHTLGREISVTDPGLHALPIMPLTMSIEMLAEAAALLMPGQLCIGMRDIRAYRWISFENGSATVRMEAAREETGAVRVALRRADEDGEDTALPIVEGIVLFGDRYPDPPGPGEFRLKAPRPSALAKDRLYAEGMFMGPCFRGVSSVDTVGEDGLEAELAVLPFDAFFRGRPDARFVTDPVVLDAAGQLVAYWIIDYRELGCNCYPYGLDELHLYGPPGGDGRQARGRARVRVTGENQLRSDIDVIGPQDRLWMRLVGWEDRLFILPTAFHELRYRPRETFLSTPWPEAVAASGTDSLVCRRLDDFPDKLLHAHGRMWQYALAHLALSRRERDAWRALPDLDKRRIEWLLVRIAAKDAARQFLKERHGLELSLPDVEVETDANGRPHLAGPWAGDVTPLPAISLSHSQGTGVVLLNGSGAPCGIDIETVNGRSDRIRRAALNHEERELAGSVLGSPGIDWVLRIWCAKEAAGKALGHGLPGGAGDALLHGLDGETGEVRLEIAGMLARRLPEWAGSQVQARTLHQDGLVAATVVPAAG